MGSAFHDRLLERVHGAGLSISTAEAGQLEHYFELLKRWNAKINLTALPLVRPTNQTIDRLFVEPLAAARFVRNGREPWFDLGSGGGSPAVPLRVVKPSIRLTMVESKERKCAFLKVVVRELCLTDAEVLNARFEDISQSCEHTALLVTARAVKADTVLAASVLKLLDVEGRLMLFRRDAKPVSVAGFSLEAMEQLVAPASAPSGGSASRAVLAIFRPLFHVEHSS